MAPCSILTSSCLVPLTNDASLRGFDKIAQNVLVRIEHDVRLR